MSRGLFGTLLTAIGDEVTLTRDHPPVRMHPHPTKQLVRLVYHDGEFSVRVSPARLLAWFAGEVRDLVDGDEDAAPAVVPTEDARPKGRGKAKDTTPPLTAGLALTAGEPASPPEESGG